MDMSADDAVKEEFGFGEKKKTGPKPTKRTEAIKWLRDVLANGARPAKELQEEGKESQGFSRYTLEEAKKEIGIRSDRPVIPGPWYWELPSSFKEIESEPPKELITP